MRRRAVAARQARRRSWRKLHLGTDADTGRVVAATLNGCDVDDASQVGALPHEAAGRAASFTADGAHDRDGVYGAVTACHSDAAVVVPPPSQRRAGTA